MKIIEIKTEKEEKVLQSHLILNCEAWIKKSKLYVPLNKAVRYFGTKKGLKSFIIHTSFSPVVLRQKNIDLNRLSVLALAEIIFGNEAI